MLEVVNRPVKTVDIISKTTKRGVASAAENTPYALKLPLRVIVVDFYPVKVNWLAANAAGVHCFYKQCFFVGEVDPVLLSESCAFLLDCSFYRIGLSRSTAGFP